MSFCQRLGTFRDRPWQPGLQIHRVSAFRSGSAIAYKMTVFFERLGKFSRGLLPDAPACQPTVSLVLLAFVCVCVCVCVSMRAPS